MQVVIYFENDHFLHQVYHIFLLEQLENFSRLEVGYLRDPIVRVDDHHVDPYFVVVMLLSKVGFFD
jgi:hypothetical protein